ncbi:MAG: ergothioneine biosynthesis protein EgtB [Planctomycetota bacterium]
MPHSAIESSSALLEHFRATRARSSFLVDPLAAEDMVVQSMPDVSPTKWHLAHVTWFFETFVLREFVQNYEVFDRQFEVLFNSYYETVGRMHPRAERGLLSRPTVEEVFRYREHVDCAVEELIASIDRCSEADALEIQRRLEIGLHHEEQHQELLLMDIKHVLGSNPLKPAYRPELPGPDASETRPLRMLDHDGGLVEVGHRAGSGFSYDNEGPRHEVYLRPFRIADRVVTSGEWLEFMDDGGYERVDLWLADGWSWAQNEGVRAPLYWRHDGDQHLVYSLAGEQPVDEATPVVHISYFEADAFARWAGKRLPTEFEWEAMAATKLRSGERPTGRMLGVGSDACHPRSALGSDEQWFGDLWEWTGSAYLGYPGFRPLEGSLGEYNGKFMSGQFVLRGGSCVTPNGHLRISYRNFFYPKQRWAFAGLRLAEDTD